MTHKDIKFSKAVHARWL